MQAVLCILLHVIHKIYFNFFKLYKFVYNEIKIGDKEYNFRTGEQNFINDLVEKFPDEKENIIKYVNLVKEVSQKDLFFLLKIAKPRCLARLLNP